MIIQNSVLKYDEDDDDGDDYGDKNNNKQTETGSKCRLCKQFDETV
jgi:hypothetical protein